MPKFKAPKGCDGVTLLAVYYVADKRGVVTIPHDNHAALLAIGFTPVDDSPAKPAAQPTKGSAEPLE